MAIAGSAIAATSRHDRKDRERVDRIMPEGYHAMCNRLSPGRAGDAIIRGAEGDSIRRA